MHLARSGIPIRKSPRPFRNRPRIGSLCEVSAAAPRDNISSENPGQRISRDTGKRVRPAALQRQDAPQLALVGVRPQVSIGSTVNQLHADPNLIPFLQDGSFDDAVDLYSPRTSSTATSGNSMATRRTISVHSANTPCTTFALWT